MASADEGRAPRREPWRGELVRSFAPHVATSLAASARGRWAAFVVALATVWLGGCTRSDHAAGEGGNDAGAPTERAAPSASEPAGQASALASNDVAPVAKGPGKRLDAESISATVRANKAAVWRQCWGSEAERVPKADISVAVVVDADGQVTSAKATGDHPEVARCVESQVRKWRFEGGGNAVIPFFFRH